MQPLSDLQSNLSFDDFKAEVLNDYKIAVMSRECSLLGRREVLTGKAKFGIFGDGKEIAQLAMAKAFLKGDWRSGYYRDQTFMMAIGELNAEQFFAGLYANTNLDLEPMSAGRQMGGHFATHSLDDNGNWKDLTKQYNSSADISPTAGQMPRLLGLAQASKIFRNVEGISSNNFSVNGNEVAWGTIGNASTSEGLFFETINAAGVLQVPMVVSIWDDEYGISVHAKDHTTKENISEVLKGFQRDNENKGFEILRVKGWDYPNLMETYQEAATIESGISTNEALTEIERSIKRDIRVAKKNAWSKFLKPIQKEQQELISILKKVASSSENGVFITKLKDSLEAIGEPTRRDILSHARKTLRYIINESSQEKKELRNWINQYFEISQPRFSSHLYSETNRSNTLIKEVKAIYDENAPQVDGRIILRDNFEALFSNYPEALVFGEDTGNIGDVNQGLEGLQEKFGKLRVADTGIREATILGQGIGMALRGLRPIAEIQYLDYILYALQIISDDLATTHYRTKGKQKAPLIIRTRGHRLEGIWHSGSQMGGVLNLIRGVHVLVPRNMTKAAGFYNTLMQGDDPALVVECLNGYRLKEKLPTNLGDIKTPIGVVETVKEGTDITLVSYGSTLRIVEQTAKALLTVGIDAEIIDVQSLLPFDLNHDIVKSIAKTNRVMIIDEDVPGGASAYILNEILNTQNGYQYLDSQPKTMTAKAHRPAYGNDGDYFSKPSEDDIFEAVYAVMHELSPTDFPKLR